MRDGFNPSSTAITPASIPKLHEFLYDNYNDYNTLTQPIVATNLGSHQVSIFVGGVKGVLHSYDGLTGNLIWQDSFGQQSFSCGGNPIAFGIGGTQVYDPVNKLVYVTDDQNSVANGPSTITLYKVDAASGTVLGSVNVAPAPLAGELNFSHTGLTLGANGMIYVGTGSTCDISSWRGRVAEVNPANMTLVNTFYTTFGQQTNPAASGPASGTGGPNFSGGGVWGWGGVSIDPSGNVYAGVGNADTSSSPQSPFVVNTNGQANAYGNHLVQLSGDLTTVESSNYPGFSGNDVDFSGTPVLFQPSGCGSLMSASQGKGGVVEIYNTSAIGKGPVYQLQLSPGNDTSGYIGNPGYSPQTGFVYASAASPNGGAYPPGMVAISTSNCLSFQVAWHATFGPDSFAYPNANPRSAPTATAGGVVFMGTACTPDSTNTICTTPSASNEQGAVWAVNAANGTVLNGGNPVLITGGPVKMAPVVDGDNVYVVDNNGELYGLSIDSDLQLSKAERQSIVTARRRPVAQRALDWR